METHRDRYGNTTEQQRFLRTLPLYWQLQREKRRGTWLVRIGIVAGLVALWAVL
jgi:hypothetical protein